MQTIVVGRLRTVLELGRVEKPSPYAGMPAGIAGKGDELLVVVVAAGGSAPGGTPAGICDRFCCTFCSNDADELPPWATS